MSSDPRWRENQVVARAVSGSANELIPALERIVDTGHWREFVHPMQGVKRYESFGDYCRDFLELTPEAVESLLDSSMFPAAAAKVRRLIREGVQPVAEHGEIGNGRSRGGVTTSKEENDATYVLARLKRDQPELAQRVIDGELSPNAAAIKAGIRKSYFRCRSDSPQLAVASLLRHYTREQVLAALEMNGIDRSKM